MSERSLAVNLELTGQQTKILRNAINSAFTDTNSLNQFLREELDKPALEDFTRGNSRNERTSSLILTAQAEGWLPDLVAKLEAYRPNNSLVRNLAERLGNLLSHTDGADHVAFESLLAANAGDANSERREQAAEALAERYVGLPQQVEAFLKKLLESSSEVAGRTAVRAAYYTSRRDSGAREVFLCAAQSQSPSLRQAAKDALYLIWRKNPKFADDTLDALLKRITLHKLLSELLSRKNAKNAWCILGFFVDLSITIYVNHCERPEVAKETDRLYHELATCQLPLDAGVRYLGSEFLMKVFKVINNRFGKPILNFMLFNEPADHFFGLPLEQRACLEKVAPLLDPASELGPFKERLADMLQSDVLFFNAVAALILAIHACEDFSRTQPLLRELFEALNGRGRLWELFSFSVLLHDTPPEWIGLLEEFTRQLVREHPDMFYDWKLDRFDIVFLPLGLAYGKRDTDTAMNLFVRLIRQGRQDHDGGLRKRCLCALGPVGFYYPKAVLATLRQAILDDPDEALQQDLLGPLAIMRTLHFDEVDQFIQRLGLGEDFRRRVAAEADLELVQRYIYWLGLYNNAVHFSLRYPKMRRALSMGALQSMAKARTPIDFMNGYTKTAWEMFTNSGFRLLEWTRPD